MRVRAELQDGRSIYMQGRISLEEALSAFEQVCEVVSLQKYERGERVVAWKRGEGWI